MLRSTSSMMMLAALAVLAVAYAQPRPPATAYRLISITKWNSTANIAALQAAEEAVSRNCSSWFVAGVTGFSLQRRSELQFGSHIKVYDFQTPVQYTNYSTCVAVQPGRAFSQPFEIWKNRVLFPYTGTVAAAIAGSYWTSTIANVTNVTAVINAYTSINAEVSGQLSSVRQVARNFGGVALPLDVAHVATFLKPQGATGFLGYLNENATQGIPVLDHFRIVQNRTTVARRIFFAPIVLKAPKRLYY